MIYSSLINENQLDEWVRGNARIAQGMIVELVWRLVAASSPKPKERRFPLGDSIGQPGPDGYLDVDFSFPPFVPEGPSFWEIGTGVGAREKATKDYRELTAAIPKGVRRASTFVFITPLSGRRDWQDTWKEDQQAAWLEERRSRNDWRDVRVIDGTRLIDWLHHFPSVQLWLARTMGLPVHQLETPEQRWEVLRTIGDPPPLSPEVFLANRDAACAKLNDVFTGTAVQLQLDTRFPEQAADFVSAFIAAMDEESRIDAASRCLIITGPDAWNALVAQREAHTLIADAGLDLTDSAGTKLLQAARRAHHAVIYPGMPGGIPHPVREDLRNPKPHHIKDALEKAGYSEERARVLAQKSAGNLGSLLRCLQNLSLMPEWAQGTPAAELAIAMLLGSWNEPSTADRTVAEGISGNSYGEWIRKVRDAALRSSAPLIHRDGTWRFVGRYEGWYTLGAHVFDEHLDRLRATAHRVLTMPDPRFELQQEERYMARIYGKVPGHSESLRSGLAETLALLGSHPGALTSCSFAKAETTASIVVRDALADGSWVRWASLNDLLPLMAEAAPAEFLDAVEVGLKIDPCPFDILFSQESSGIFGATYMTGLLWALETLAWDAQYLTRVVIILGELAARDPGGNWGNRPDRSLTTILLPWMPQTCATVERRKAAVAALLDELPDVAWKLLLSLLHEAHHVSQPTRRPAWREMIPDDWSDGVTYGEYWEQSVLYSELAVGAAISDPEKLAELVDHMHQLPSHALEKLLAHLGSDAIVSMPEAGRVGLWTELVNLVTKHRKYSDAEWAMNPAQIDTIEVIAARLAPEAPAFRYKRLFSEQTFDLFEEKGSYEEQRNRLEERRQEAVKEIAAAGGVQAVLSFATSTESPWQVGVMFGIVADDDADQVILPRWLNTSEGNDGQFGGGFVWGRFRSRGWAWVDAINTSRWDADQIGVFLAYLPFTPNTWERVARLLEEDESLYWTRTTANAYEAKAGLELAVDKLIRFARPLAAMQCLQRMRDVEQAFDNARVVRALLAAVNSFQHANTMDEYVIVELIKALQDDPETNPDDLVRVEWAYLPLLDKDQGVSAKLLERRLAEDPGFFCEVIRLVFRSTKGEQEAEPPSANAQSIASNGYRLLREWRTPPGSRKDGSYDGEVLTAWLDEVKQACVETGHLEIAMEMVGHVLIHTPADPDGLWIHRTAAAALNDKNAGHMREGFQVELLNSRGMHWIDPSGKPEMGLAEKYRQQADQVENARYPRLAATLRELASFYDREAERIIRDHEEDD